MPKLLHSTIKAEIITVKTEFHQTMKPEPAVDRSGGIPILIQWQLQGYEDAYYSPLQAVVVSLLVSKAIAHYASSHKLLTLSHLILGFFFCLCSCKYVKTRRDRKTMKLCVKNLKFYKGRTLIGLSEDLDKALHVLIMVVFQKKRTRMQTISQRSSGLCLCPVRCWAQLV